MKKTKKNNSLFPRFILGIATAVLGVATYTFVKSDKMQTKKTEAMYDTDKNNEERLFV